MHELTVFEKQLVGGGFSEIQNEHQSKVLTKEDVCFFASMGVILRGITGIVKLSSHPLIGVSMGAVAGGIFFAISANYFGKMMVAAYEMTGVI